jgi:hypothetical protein
LHSSRRRDFALTYGAVAISELGDAFQYVALMWFALVAGGPLGVLAVRLADSVPALVFGFHGGLVADRRDRRRVLIACDLVRAAVLVPVALGGVTGRLPLAGLAAAFGLTCHEPLRPRVRRARSSARRPGERPGRSCAPPHGLGDGASARAGKVRRAAPTTRAGRRRRGAWHRGDDLRGDVDRGRS